MADRHIKAWSGFLTVYHTKTRYIKGEADVRLEDGEVKIVGSLDVEPGVTSVELAEVLDCTNETARRRFRAFADAELVAVSGKSGKADLWKPRHSIELVPSRVVRILEEM